MALSVSSLAAALSHLSLPSTSTSKPHPAPFLRLHSTSRCAVSLALRASAAEAAEPAEADLPAEEVVAVEEDALSGAALRKYVKQRLPGGFAAQRITATGRRKTASARVVLQEGTGKVFINFRDAKEYLQGNPIWMEYCKVPLATLGFENNYDVFVKVQGGGLSGQAQAICLGVARALVKISNANRVPLRSEGLLTRDTRIVERKKAGLKKARKRPQFSKR
ncbi:30S ribosomal protein S9, chloroplastic [Dichanthelium oligosanthes]|uniref:Small ribosomal subunit protein uS9c n=1 Tax=Dichanthelium oligosanthes TaxID=888268 RepID=A0A1E5WD71_9POAL|nr:30S ribosomal protein S9, chloroplastic [Dichanthelium oligosanthes]